MELNPALPCLVWQAVHRHPGLTHRTLTLLDLGERFQLLDSAGPTRDFPSLERAWRDVPELLTVGAAEVTEISTGDLGPVAAAALLRLDGAAEQALRALAEAEAEGEPEDDDDAGPDDEGVLHFLEGEYGDVGLRLDGEAWRWWLHAPTPELAFVPDFGSEGETLVSIGYSYEHSMTGDSWTWSLHHRDGLFHRSVTTDSDQDMGADRWWRGGREPAKQAASFFRDYPFWIGPDGSPAAQDSDYYQPDGWRVFLGASWSADLVPLLDEALGWWPLGATLLIGAQWVVKGEAGWALMDVEPPRERRRRPPRGFPPALPPLPTVTSLPIGSEGWVWISSLRRHPGGLAVRADASVRSWGAVDEVAIRRTASEVWEVDVDGVDLELVEPVHDAADVKVHPVTVRGTPMDPRLAIAPALRDALATAVLQVGLERSAHVLFPCCTPQLPGLDRPKLDRTHVLSAWKPPGAVRDGADDHSTWQRLVDELQRDGLALIPAAVMSPDGRDVEEGVAVARWSREAAIAAAQRHGHTVVFELCDGEMRVVRAVDGAVLSRRWWRTGR